MSAREEAIQNLAKVADDWGWKGGKPGEVSAEMFGTRFRNPTKRAKALSDAGKKAKEIRKLANSNPEHPAVKAFNKSMSTNLDTPTSRLINPASISQDELAGIKLMDIFQWAGAYGIPRRYTSRVAELATEPWVGFMQSGFVAPDVTVMKDLSTSLQRLKPLERDLFFDIAKAASPSGGALFENIEIAARAAAELPDDVRPAFMAIVSMGHNFANAERAALRLMDMTPDQRQTFLNLLPRWTGTLETAFAAAKKLYRRPS